MPKMRTSVEVRNQVLEMSRREVGIKKIAIALKISKNTVRKILRQSDEDKFDRIIANTTNSYVGALSLLRKLGFRPLKIVDAKMLRADSQYWELTSRMQSTRSAD